MLGFGAAVTDASAMTAEATAAPPAAAAWPGETTPIPAPLSLQVGEATSHLLALQRSGAAASPTARPIAGDVASLSYQRYLDSFTHPIPETFNTTVKSSSGSGSSGQ